MKGTGINKQLLLHNIKA